MTTQAREEIHRRARLKAEIGDRHDEGNAVAETQPMGKSIKPMKTSAGMAALFLRTKAILLHRLGDRFAFADRVVDLAEHRLEGRVARGFAGDVQGLQDRHAAGHQRAQRPHGAGDDVLFDKLAEDRHLDREDSPSPSAPG